LRRSNAAVPRDLDVVLQKAMEKDPERRYQDVAAFAAELRAILELRPIAARPPGLVRRAGKWARRNRVAATALGGATVALLGAAVFAKIRVDHDRSERRTLAAGLIENARGVLAGSEQGRSVFDQAYWEAQRLRGEQKVRWLEPAEQAQLESAEAIVSASRSDREVTFATVLGNLSQAERLDPEAAQADAVWAAFYYQRWLDARDAADKTSMALYRGLIEEKDPGSEFARRAAGRVPLVIESDPPGAAVHLFRYLERADLIEGDEPRLIPVAAFRKWDTEAC